MKPVTFPMISLLVVSVREAVGRRAAPSPMANPLGVAAVPCGRGCHFAGTVVFLAFAIVLPAA